MVKASLNTILLFICLVFGKALTAQHNPLSPDKNQLFFSAVKGTESRSETVTLRANKASTGLVTRITGQYARTFKILSKLPGQISTNQKVELALVFNAPNEAGIAGATLEVADPLGKLLAKVNLTGLSLKGLEGENEPTLKAVMQALGYHVNVGWNTLANHVKPHLQGDEIVAGSFKKAEKGKVTMIPVARFSPDFEVPFGYYTTSPAGPHRQQVGVLSKTVSKPEHQTLFPAVSSGTTLFDPGENVFGFYTTGTGHSAYTEDAWNIELHPKNAGHAVRTYPLKDKQGKLLKGTYIVCFEEAKNGDYNDYVFLVTNVKPVTAK